MEKWSEAKKREHLWKQSTHNLRTKIWFHLFRCLSCGTALCRIRLDLDAPNNLLPWFASIPFSLMYFWAGSLQKSTCYVISADLFSLSILLVLRIFNFCFQFHLILNWFLFSFGMLLMPLVFAEANKSATQINNNRGIRMLWERSYPRHTCFSFSRSYDVFVSLN